MAVKRKKTKKKSPKIHGKQLEKIVRSIIAEIVEVDEKKIGLNTSFAKDLDMDSMTALEILAAVEKKYKIEIPEESLPEMKSLKDVLRLTERLLQ